MSLLLLDPFSVPLKILLHILYDNKHHLHMLYFSLIFLLRLFLNNFVDRYKKKGKWMQNML